MAWAQLIGGGMQMGGAAMGAAAAAEDREAARRAYDASVRDYEAIGIPPVEAQRIVMEEYQSQGKWTPELEEAVKLGDSEMLGISLDPRYKEAQLGALDQLQQIADSGGMTLSDKASLEKTMADINADERGAREAILADSKARGDFGSGKELAAQLMNQQDSAGRAHSAGLNTAAIAQQRALDAIMQGGQLAGSLRSQEFGEKEKAAAAQDAIKQWNAQNTQAVRGRNVGLGNEAQQYNLGNTQRIADANVDSRNKAQTYNQNLYQQNFDNQVKLAAGKSNARSGQASSLNDAADRTAGQWAGIGQGAGQIASAYGQQQRSDARYEDQTRRADAQYNDYMDRVYGKKK